jgi:hypothetical protein
MTGPRIRSTSQVVRLVDRKAQFFEQRFEVFFGRLLTMKAQLVIQGFAASLDEFGGPIILLGLADPFPRRPFHTGPCLS